MFMWEDKHYFRWANSLSPFHGELVGFSHCDSSYYQARKESDVTVLEFVTKGTGTLKVNGTTYHPKAGDVYLLPLYNEKKHEIAKMLLTETDLPIEQIAASLGFQSSEHFSTQFKNLSSVSPRAYRIGH